MSSRVRIQRVENRLGAKEVTFHLQCHSLRYLQCIFEWSDTNGKFQLSPGTRGICPTFHNQAQPGHSLREKIFFTELSLENLET